MTKVVSAVAVSLDGIAGPEAADADGMELFAAILGWQFPLRSWRAQQGQEGGEDSVDSKGLQDLFDRFGPQAGRPRRAAVRHRPRRPSLHGGHPGRGRRPPALSGSVTWAWPRTYAVSSARKRRTSSA